MANFKQRIKRILGSGIVSKLHKFRNVIAEEQEYQKWIASDAGKRNLVQIRDLKDIYIGKPGFVIGNGPSLNKIDIARLADQVTIGSNSIFLLKENAGFVPKYYTVEDHLVAEDRKAEIMRLGGTQKIFPFDLKNKFDESEALFVNFRRNYYNFPRFSKDLDKVAFWGGTVTFLNIQLASYLGCNPIYLVGVDHSYRTDVPVKKDGAQWTSLGEDVNHFHPDYFGKGFRWHDPNVRRMEESYQCAKRYCDAVGIEIFNSTVGGKLEVFPRRDFNSISL
jgi:hypothetical protein